MSFQFFLKMSLLELKEPGSIVSESKEVFMRQLMLSGFDSFYKLIFNYLAYEKK